MSPETIDAMLAAGVTAEVLAAAWKADIAIQAKATEERRSKDRDRQRRHRESRDVTVTGCDPAPNERDNLTPTRETKTEPKGSSKSMVFEERKAAIASCLHRAFPTPDGVTEEQWAAFRQQRKKALNTRSYALLTAKLIKLAEDGWPPGEMIDLAIERGWETVFAPRDQGNERRTNGMGRHQSPDGLSPTTRAALAVFGPAGAG